MNIWWQTRTQWIIVSTIEWSDLFLYYQINHMNHLHFCAIKWAVNWYNNVSVPSLFYMIWLKFDLMFNIILSPVKTHLSLSLLFTTSEKSSCIWLYMPPKCWLFVSWTTEMLPELVALLPQWNPCRWPRMWQPVLCLINQKGHVTPLPTHVCSNHIWIIILAYRVIWAQFIRLLFLMEHHLVKSSLCIRQSQNKLTFVVLWWWKKLTNTIGAEVLLDSPIQRTPPLLIHLTHTSKPVYKLS